MIEIKKRSKLKESHEKRIILRPILKKYKYMVNNSINQLPGATQKAGLWVCRGSAHFFSKTHLWSPKQTETSKQTHKRHVIQSKPTSPRTYKRLRVVPLCNVGFAFVSSARHSPNRFGLCARLAKRWHKEHARAFYISSMPLLYPHETWGIGLQNQKNHVRT